MNGITNFTSVSGNISPHGEVFGGGGGAPAADEDVGMVQPRSSVTLLLDVFTVIAGFVPGKLAGVSRGLTVIDPNAKLGMLKKVQRLNVFSYLQGELPQNINPQNLNFESIRLINSLFKRVCTDTASLDSIISNRESSIQDVYGILQGTDTSRRIQEGKDRSLQRFAEVLREGEHALAIPANSTPQQIRAWFADEANQEVLRGVTELNLPGLGLRHLPDEIGRFRNLEHLNLSNNPLSSVPDSIRNWFLAAVTQSAYALQYASAELKADRDFMLAAVSQNGYALQFAAEALRADRDVVLAAVMDNGDALQFAADELRADKEVVLAAVSNNGWVLGYAADELKADRGVVLAAVSRHGDALQFAAEALRADREVVLAAVTQNAYALQYASAELRADRDVVLAAVSRHNDSLKLTANEPLQFAADELRADREVVLAAVRKNGRALRWVADELRADREVVLAAVRQNGVALRYASAALQADPEIRAAAGLV